MKRKNITNVVIKICKKKTLVKIYHFSEQSLVERLFEAPNLSFDTSYLPCQDFRLTFLSLSSYCCGSLPSYPELFTLFLRDLEVLNTLKYQKPILIFFKTRK